MPKKNFEWSPLDNAAKIFPAVKSSELTSVMRLMVVLKQPVTISKLYKAVECSTKRFSYFIVNLKKGFFWYYLQQSKDPIQIIEDKGIPCKAFNHQKDNNLLIRILVHANTISIECSHIITDGYGLLTFLKSVLYFYFREKGLINDTHIDSFYTLEPNAEEYEDAYNHFFKNNIPPIIRLSKSFHLPFHLKPKPRFSILLSVLSTNELLTKAKEKEVSITVYLVAAYLFILQEIYNETHTKGLQIKNRIGRIQVPVNLRNIYPTKCMRNFSLFVMPEIDYRLGNYSFDEILKKVYYQMKLDTDEKNLSKIISRNVSGEKNTLVRRIPLWLKNILLYTKYYSEGVNQFSGVITNLGKINLHEKISDQIDYFVITPPPPNKRLKLNCGVISYKDKLVLSFGNITKSNDFEKRFLKFLIKQGIKIKITEKPN
ncbi:MAG: hypothetical protein JW717_06480 [Marinilabiliaceae bacterium]|nr:hypothetical protein [Marinilabiliaceae bacterium]